MLLESDCSGLFVIIIGALGVVLVAIAFNFLNQNPFETDTYRVVTDGEGGYYAENKRIYGQWVPICFYEQELNEGGHAFKTYQEAKKYIRLDIKRRRMGGRRIRFQEVVTDENISSNASS